MNELTYWITLTFMQGITTKRKNEIYVACYTNNPRISIIQLFEDSSLWKGLGLSNEECDIFATSRSNLANNSFLAESLISQGYDIIPIEHKDYSRTLKLNLKTNCPNIIFTKGNKSLLQEPSVAIVGSRNAEPISLQFTSDITKKNVAEGKVIVSGFAQGIDRMALDAALEADGKSIIVLPQGITTFTSGYKQYYKQILQGRLLVLSAFQPNAPWTVEFAMMRNPYIYGLANEIYVAQSDNKGGTWAGVIDGLRKKRTIYVRKPDSSEDNANILLIQKGAIPVNINGDVIQLTDEEMLTPSELEKRNLDEKIKDILNKCDKTTSKQLIEQLALDWSETKMKNYLDRLSFIEKYKQNNRIYYRLKSKDTNQLQLDFS